MRKTRTRTVAVISAWCLVVFAAGMATAGNPSSRGAVPLTFKIDGADTTFVKAWVWRGTQRVRLSSPSSTTIPLVVTLPSPVVNSEDASTHSYGLKSLTYTSSKQNNPVVVPIDAMGKLTIDVASANEEVTLQLTAVYGIRKNDNGSVSDKVKQRNLDLPYSSNVLRVMVDSLRPQPMTNIEVDRFPGGSAFIRINLEDDDLDETQLPAASFQVVQKVPSGSNGTVDVPVKPSEPIQYSATTKRITLAFPNLNPGNYELTIGGLQDKVGNPMAAVTGPEPFQVSFNVGAGKLVGKHIEYPEFLGPNNNVTGDQPSHRVETRVVRLYYFRDARRVVELLNRNAKNLNQTGYDQAQRLAADGREKAEDSTDERRTKEALAIQAAQQTRGTRADLLQADNNLQSTSRKKNLLSIENDRITAELNGIKSPPEASDPDSNILDAHNAAITVVEGNIMTTEEEIKNAKKPGSSTAGELPRLRSELTTHQSRLALLKSTRKRIVDLTERKDQNSNLIGDYDLKISSLNSRIPGLQTQLQQDQIKEIATRNKVDVAEAKESRARKEQFRREVAAGLADPDTYAAGKLESIDPITQVSMSVIGEGAIQLRGPIKGINKVRRLIHQLDSPVGQVKVGIHTIQVNGEHGDRMELVYEEIEKHVAHSRFLANQSGLLVRKAVSRVASKIADKVDRGYIPPGCESMILTDDGQILGQDNQPLRDQRYLHAFFGQDFIHELQRMNSELLNTDNKLLSLNSMDTLSLSGALFVTAVAKNEIRLEIVREFQRLLCNELPVREVEYFRSLTRTRHADPHHNKFAKKYLQGVLDWRDKKRLLKNARRTYRFPNSVSFFNNQLAGTDTLNAMQVATIRLAQALKAQLVAEMEYKNYVLERSLLKQKKVELENITRKNSEEAIFEQRQINAGQGTRGSEDKVRALRDRIKITQDRIKDVEEKLEETALLEQFIDEQEEKSVELLEAMRSHSANVDNYLKRLAIALEDDINAQFYNPAFQDIRRVSRTWDVNLGQIETTTILTNNRTFAKVAPEATIEFDLPKRDILITEAMKGAKALTTEYGNLMQDGTFLATTSMLSGQSAGGLVGSQTPLQELPGLSTGESNEFGAALEGLIPDPSVYKFETGTGFEIRPVIQPDGHSIVYNFNYMYTTNVREPVRADEKHLGRVKRHFIHTDVQTSSYELREVSRYTVALKASRTSRGVPLLEDVPVAGALFRPLPSAESSLQQNIILASSVVYPTLFDLMGLRWSPYVDQLSSPSLESQKMKQLSRRNRVRDKLISVTQEAVNEQIDLGASSYEHLPSIHEIPEYEGIDVYPDGTSQDLNGPSHGPYVPPQSQESSERSDQGHRPQPELVRPSSPNHKKYTSPQEFPIPDNTNQIQPSPVIPQGSRVNRRPVQRYGMIKPVSRPANRAQPRRTNGYYDSRRHAVPKPVKRSQTRRAEKPRYVQTRRRSRQQQPVQQSVYQPAAGVPDRGNKSQTSGTATSSEVQWYKPIIK